MIWPLHYSKDSRKGCRDFTWGVITQRLQQSSRYQPDTQGREEIIEQRLPVGHCNHCESGRRIRPFVGLEFSTFFVVPPPRGIRRIGGQ